MPRIHLALSLTLLLALALLIGTARAATSVVLPIAWSTGSSSGTTFPLSNTIVPGYSTYFWVGASDAHGSSATLASGNWLVTTSSFIGASSPSHWNESTIGYNTISAPGTLTASSGTLYGAVVIGYAANLIYANRQSGSPYSISSNTANSLTLSPITVSASNSFMLLVFASGGNVISSFSTNAPTPYTAVNTAYGGLVQATMLTFNNIPAGTYNAFERTQTPSVGNALSIAAYVWNPYTVTLNNNGISGTTMGFAGTNYANGAQVSTIGNAIIVANSGGTGYAFNTWISSSATNIVIQNTASSTTNVIIKGTGTITANYILTTNALVATPNPPTVSNTIIDVGQISVMQTVISTNGISYLGNWIYASPTANIVNGNTILFTISNTVAPINTLMLTVNAVSNTQLILGFNTLSTSTPNSLTLTASGSNNIVGIWTFNGFAEDLGTLLGKSTNTIITIGNTIRVSNALGGNTLTESPKSVSQGQTEVLTGTITGGSSPYTYNFMVVNTVNGNIITSTVVTNALASNTFTFTVPTSAQNANSIGVVSTNAIVTDSATTNMITMTYNTITISSQANSCTPTPGADWNINCADNCVETSGSVTVANVYMTGTGTFTANGYNVIMNKLIIAKTCTVYLRNNIKWKI